MLDFVTAFFAVHVDAKSIFLGSQVDQILLSKQKKIESAGGLTHDNRLFASSDLTLDPRQNKVVETYIAHGESKFMTCQKDRRSRLALKRKIPLVRV